MKKKLLTTLCALTAASTVAAAPISTQAASLSTALQSKGACVNKVVVTNKAASIEEIRQLLSDLGKNCNLPSDSENDNAQLPEVETPGKPETETPNLPENDTSGKPETETPEKPENAPSEEADTNAAYVNRIVELVNEERAKVGLSPVTLDKKVQAAAQVRAKEIVTSFSHTRPDGTSFSTALKEQNVSYRGSGENIAWGQKSPEAVMNAWMNSSGHRANILNKNFKIIGVGYCRTANGTNHWAQLFTY